MGRRDEGAGTPPGTRAGQVMPAAMPLHPGPAPCDPCGSCSRPEWQMTQPLMIRLPSLRHPPAQPFGGRSKALLAVTLFSAILQVPCRSAQPEPLPVNVQVVAHGWHSGIVVPATLARDHNWPAWREFPQARYFEVGWGDRSYYQAADPGWWMGLRALLWPNPGVLHVVALQEPPQRAFRGAPVVNLQLPHEGAQRLAASIAASHERGVDAAPLAFGPALYGQGRFYPSVERFHLLATCNVWVARRLREAGLDLQPAFALTSGLLLHQLKRLETSAPTTPAASAAPPASRPG